MRDSYAVTVMPNVTTVQKEPTVPVQIRMPVSLVDGLRKNAVADDRTLSSVVRHAAREYLSKQDEGDSGA
jgi:hypothetical protein